MNRPFDRTWLPLLACSLVGAALASAFWWWRRRVIDAEHQRHRMLAEAESDRLRLRISSLKAAEARADDLQVELLEKRADAARVPALLSEVKALRARVETIPDLERELATVRERADEADAMASELAALRSQAADGDGAGASDGDEARAADGNGGGAADGDGGGPPAIGRPTSDGAMADHRDDLQVVYGIGPVTEKTLNALGIRTWEQLAAMTPAEAIRVDEALGSFRGRIERDQWIGQAADLIRRFPLRDPYDRPDRKTLRNKG